MKPQTALTTVVALLFVGSAVGAAAVPGPGGSSGGFAQSPVTGLEGASGEVLGTDDGTDVDGNDSLTVAPSTARETARAALSVASDGNWTLTEFSVHEEDGYYEFEYVVDATPDGEAEVRVDGESGDLIRLEIEGLDDRSEDEDETEDEDQDEDETEDEGEDETEDEDQDEDETEDEDQDEDETEDEDDT